MNPRRLSCPVFRQSARSGNKGEGKQTLKRRATGNDVITNVISPMSISHRLLERRSSSMVRYLRFCIRNNTSYSSTICAKIPYAHFLRLNNTLDGVNYSLSNEYPVSCIFAGLLVKLTNFCLKYTGQTTIEDTPWSTRGQITLPLNFFLICASCCFEIVWFIVANVNFFFSEDQVH